MVGMSYIYKPNDDKAKLTEGIVDNNSDIYAGAPHDIFIIPNKFDEQVKRRSRLCSYLLCIFTCALFVCFLMFGILLLYSYFARPQTWYNTCSVRYRAPQSGYLIDKGGLNADDLVDKPIFKPVEIVDDEIEDGESGEFKQIMSLNSTDQTERIEVPKIDDYKQAIFVHDFAMNWSVINDVYAKRCFIMALDRSKISPPKDIFDIILKTKQGYYLPDNLLVHQYMVVQQQLTDLAPFGANIEKNCKASDSYLMVKRPLVGADHSIDKRDSADRGCEFLSNFMHSTGRLTLVHHLHCL